jgi:adenylate cyclase
VAKPLVPGERKLATLLFADLSGYTDLTRRLDPEDVVSVVDPVMRDLQQIAERHGGTVVLVAGDGLLVAFGVPHAREDDSLRAVRAAVEMRQRTGRSQGTPGLHAGIASGEVLITPDPSERGWGITGLCIALAARLSDKAENGVILVDAESQRLVGPDARWGDRRQLELQGMGPAPVTVFELLDAEAGPAPRGSGTFVDRFVEWARLDELLSEVRVEGHSRVVAIEGEAGSGKTRLLEAWSTSHTELVTIWGRCPSYGEHQPLAGLLDALIDHLGEVGLLDPPALTELLQGVSPEEAQATALRLLGHAGVNDAPPAAEQLVEVLGSATRELLSGLSTRSSLAIVIDDVHWGGEDLREFLWGLVKEPLTSPVLIVVLQREGEAWGDLPALPPLPTWAAKELITARIGEAAPTLVNHLLSRTGGMPFYLEECLSLLVEQGAVLDDSDGRRLADPGGLGSLPTSVRAVLAARLDALPAAAKDVALVASASADLIRAEAVSELMGPSATEG